MCVMYMENDIGRTNDNVTYNLLLLQMNKLDVYTTGSQLSEFSGNLLTDPHGTAMPPISYGPTMST